MIPPLTAARAERLIEAFQQKKVLILGDVMVDHFVVGKVNRISPEAPVPIVVFDHEFYRPGGAANVAGNVRALGGAVDLVGLVGEDAAAHRLRDLLQVSGVPTSALVSNGSRRTTTKVRVVTTRNQQVARIDYESDDSASAEVEDALASRVNELAAGAAVIVVSDYLKGAVTRRVMASLVGAAHAAGVPVLVDPKVPHLEFYAGATLITPNHVEAEAATHLPLRSDADAARVAARFRECARCDGVLITRGEHGMWLACDGVEGPLSATAREVADVTGAGDTVVATLALALAAGASAAEAASLANAAAGIVVGKFGPSTVSPEDLLSAAARQG